jgi:hypothetical protein
MKIKDSPVTLMLAALILTAILLLATSFKTKAQGFNTNTPGLIPYGTPPTPVLTATNDFYQSLGTPYTNQANAKGPFRVPYATASGTWSIQWYVTNYYGAVGASNTITNVTGYYVSSTNGVTNQIDGTLYSNSVFNVTATTGTVSLVNQTNNQSYFSWQ